MRTISARCKCHNGGKHTLHYDDEMCNVKYATHSLKWKTLVIIENFKIELSFCKKKLYITCWVGGDGEQHPDLSSPGRCKKVKSTPHPDIWIDMYVTLGLFSLVSVIIIMFNILTEFSVSLHMVGVSLNIIESIFVFNCHWVYLRLYNWISFMVYEFNFIRYAIFASVNYYYSWKSFLNLRYISVIKALLLLLQSALDSL